MYPQDAASDSLIGQPGRFDWRRLIFWDFARASWQYDIVVGLILLFVFVTPRPWFHDQPRAVGVVLIANAEHESRFYISGQLLNGATDAVRRVQAEKLIHDRTGKRSRLVRLESIQDAEDRETRGFLAYTHP